jgi:hypothetical protein
VNEQRVPDFVDPLMKKKNEKYDEINKQFKKKHNQNIE